MQKTILSLFDYSGNWSKPYRDNGYNVIQVDIKHGIDILTWDYSKIENVHGILAAPMCTCFSKVSAWKWQQFDDNGDTDYAIKLVKKTLEIVEYFTFRGLQFWALENPAGRLDKLVPELRKYRLYSFQPCDFGEDYKKYTVLWGYFNPLFVLDKRKPVFTSGSGHALDVKLNTNKKNRQELRSVTPLKFAYSFYNSNL